MQSYPTSQPSVLEKLARLKWIHVPVLAFLLTRLGIALVAYISMPLVNDSNVPPYHIRPDNQLLDVFGSRWDTGFYLSITEEGYKNEGVTFPSTPFFPLLPLLMRFVKLITRDALLAGVWVANLSLLAAAIVFYRLAADEFGAETAGRTVWYLLIFPASLFGSAIYTESLFLLCAVSALYLFRKGFWGSAAVLGFLSGLTRFMGLLVAPLLLVEWWMRRRQSPPGERPAWAALIAPAAVPLGTAAYMLYLRRQFGDPLAFLHASAAWGRQPVSPLGTILGLFQTPPQGWLAALGAGQLQLDNLMDLAFVTLFLALGIVLLFQKRWGEGIFVVLGALVPLSSGLLMSQRRYMWVLFPAFLLLARWGENLWVDRLIVTFSLLGLGLYTVLFANWYWVG